MNHLFNVFETSGNLGPSTNWFCLIVMMFMFPTSFFLKKNHSEMAFINFSKFVQNEIKFNFNKTHLSMMVIMMTLFFMILFINIISFMPFIFTGTSHLVFTLSLSFIMWNSYTNYIKQKNFKLTLMHMVPENSPLFLSPFLVLVEYISVEFRPYILAIRLSANMIAGHLLMELASVLMSMNIIVFFITTTMVVFLVFLEMAVAMIQSYVFMALNMLYIQEINCYEFYKK